MSRWPAIGPVDRKEEKKMKPKVVLEEVKAVEASSNDDLRHRYRNLLGLDPGGLSETYMRMRLCFAIQQLRLGGGLNQSELGILEMIASKDPVLHPNLRPVPTNRKWRKGKTWRRFYKGESYLLTADGMGRFVLNSDNQVYASPTAAARAITGTHISGRSFWGIEE